MHPRTQEILDHLDASHAELRRVVDAVPEGLRERRPAPERWSAAEVLEHLARVEGLIAGLLREPLAEAARLGEDPETDPVLPRLPVVKFLDRRRPIAATESGMPTGELDLPAAWEALEAQHTTLRRAAEAANGCALGEVKRPHPFLGELDLYQWFIFVGSHELRHAAQLREIADAFEAA